MTLTPYQLVVPVLSFFAILYAWSLFKRDKKTLWEVLLWTLFWGGIGFIALFPGLMTYLTIVTGIRSQVNAVLITAIGILTFLVFSIVVRVEQLNRKYAKIMRTLALQDAEIDDKKRG